MDEVGKDGAISVEDSQTFGIDIDVVQGMQYDRGYISPYMATDSELQEAVLNDPYILLTDLKVHLHPGYGSPAGRHHEGRPSAAHRCRRR